MFETSLQLWATRVAFRTWKMERINTGKYSGFWESNKISPAVAGLVGFIRVCLFKLRCALLSSSKQL
jgi:hypothetical protein